MTLALDAAAEVLDARAATSVPGSADWCLGLLPWRGRLLTVVDAGRLFGHRPASARHLVVLRGLPVDVALAVDGPLGLVAGAPHATDHDPGAPPGTRTPGTSRPSPAAPTSRAAPRPARDARVCDAELAAVPLLHLDRSGLRAHFAFQPGAAGRHATPSLFREDEP